MKRRVMIWLAVAVVLVVLIPGAVLAADPVRRSLAFAALDWLVHPWEAVGPSLAEIESRSRIKLIGDVRDLHAAQTRGYRSLCLKFTIPQEALSDLLAQSNFDQRLLDDGVPMTRDIGLDWWHPGMTGASWMVGIEWSPVTATRGARSSWCRGTTGCWISTPPLGRS